MKYGPPIRLTAALASHAREAAQIQERSLTEQVEHWARIGQIVEATVLSATVERLKALSHDARIPSLLAAADTVAGRRKAARLIRERNPVRHGTVGNDPAIVKVGRARRR
ncbi:MAG: hypothetical protein H0T89_21480 [Deltaproteobacteria bacterium]|nr:hypothetical protein [Deltaproteobacteria bacterium]MDQ3297401.1 ParD-like family protein [Myxococcota bacterium]